MTITLTFILSDFSKHIKTNPDSKNLKNLLLYNPLNKKKTAHIDAMIITNDLREQ